MNIGNYKRKIYLFNREEDGTLRIEKDENFWPFYFEPDPQGTFRGYDGMPLKKVIVSSPEDIISQRSPKSYSSDVKYVNNYLIHKVEKIEKSNPKILFIDIEVLTDKDFPNPLEAKHPVSCITIYNNYTKEYHTWWLPEYESEDEMLKDLSFYIHGEAPDLLLAWNIKFDYVYLANRIEGFAKSLSPVGLARYGEEEQVLYPTGISVVDYLTLFKKVFMREASYALDYIAQKKLNEEKWPKTSFNELTELVKAKNINDVKRMVKLEEKFKLIPYYNEIRCLTKVKWEDLYHNSRLVEMLLFEEAKKKEVILPSKPKEVKITDFAGAIRESLLTGALFDIGKFDLGCYSSDTEILTEEGWKPYTEINIGTKVASFNININSIEFQPILHLNIQNVENCEMYRLINKRTDQLLTWNHKVLYKQTTKKYRIQDNNPESWHVQFIKDVPLHHSIFPLSGEIKIRKKDYSISDDLLKIHAWIITEGWNSKHNKNQNNSYHISQSRSKNSHFCDEINQLFTNMNWPIEERQRIRKNKTVEATWNLLVSYSKFIHVEENYKIIPLWMLQNLSLRQLNLLFDELMKGDGNKKGWCYTAHDKLARDRFQYLCCLIGRASINSNQKVVYCSKETFTSIQWSKNSKFVAGKQKTNYNGIVWCPTVSNGFVIVRRKGKSFISGNSAYPSMIVNFCLDTQNIDPIKAEDNIEIRGMYFRQNSDALLPSVVKRILTLKDDLKLAKKKDESLQTKYDAIKAITNSTFGVMGNEYFRLYNNQIAATITYLVRDLLNYTRKRLEQEGYQVVYYDTDSVFLTSKENISSKLNQYIQDWGKGYGKESIDLRFEYEGYFDKLFLLAKCHYFGYIHGKEAPEIKGIEAKRSNSSKYEGIFQKALLDKMLNKEPCEKILEWINQEKENIKTCPLEDISFPCKIQNKDYKNVPIFVRAIDVAKSLNKNFKVNIGDIFYYTFIKPICSKDNVVAFTVEDKKFLDWNKHLDWPEIVRRNILTKAQNIFEAQGWDVTRLDNVNQLTF